MYNEYYERLNPMLKKIINLLKRNVKKSYIVIQFMTL